MGKKSRLFFVSLTAASTALSGCALSRPSWFASKSPTGSTSSMAGPVNSGAGRPSQSLASQASTNPAANALSSAGTSISSSFRKASSAVGSALAPVTPASWSGKQAESSVSNDPVRLSTPLPKVTPSVYLHAAKILEAKGDINGAIKKYDEALRMAPNDQEVVISAARLYDRQSRFVDAERHYRHAIQLDPNSATVHNDLGLCLARQGKMEEAGKQISAAIGLQPNNARYHNNLAMVLLESGNKDEALRQLTAANGPAVGHYNLGQLVHQRGEVEEARELFHRAAELDPQLAPAREMLQRLGGGPPAAGPTGSQAAQLRGTQPAESQTVVPTRNFAPTRWQATTVDPEKDIQAARKLFQEARQSTQQQVDQTMSDTRRVAGEARQELTRSGRNWSEQAQQTVDEARTATREVTHSAGQEASRFAKSLGEAMRVPPVEASEHDSAAGEHAVDEPAGNNEALNTPQP